MAFREVEDNLSDLRLLNDQISAQDDAVSASQRAAHLSRTQYEEGEVSYLNVIDSERSVLVSQLQASHLEGSQAVATVNLIRALGGGWGDAKPDMQLGVQPAEHPAEHPAVQPAVQPDNAPAASAAPAAPLASR